MLVPWYLSSTYHGTKKSTLWRLLATLGCQTSSSISNIAISKTAAAAWGASSLLGDFCRLSLLQKQQRRRRAHPAAAIPWRSAWRSSSSDEPDGPGRLQHHRDILELSPMRKARVFNNSTTSRTLSSHLRSGDCSHKRPQRALSNRFSCAHQPAARALLPCNGRARAHERQQGDGVAGGPSFCGGIGGGSGSGTGASVAVSHGVWHNYRKQCCRFCLATRGGTCPSRSWRRRHMQSSSSRWRRRRRHNAQRLGAMTTSSAASWQKTRSSALPSPLPLGVVCCA